MEGLWGWPKTQRLWAKCVFAFRQGLPMWLQGNWSWVPHELCCPQFLPHLPPPSSSNAGKQLGLWMVWVFSSSLCFYLLVFLSIYRIAVVLSPWVDAGRVFLFGLCCSGSFNLSSLRLSCVRECWLLNFPVLSLVLFSSEGRKMQSLGLTQNWRCYFLHDNRKPSLIFNVLICISNCYCKCCLHSVQL